jgi:hypothetical protein
MSFEGVRENKYLEQIMKVEYDALDEEPNMEACALSLKEETLLVANGL